MRKFLTLLVVMVIGLTEMHAAYQSTRMVVKDTIVNCNIQHMHEVTAFFCRQFQEDTDALFKWAFKGAEETGASVEEKKKKDNPDAIALRYQERTYNPQTKVGDLAIDIYVLGTAWWRNQHLGTQTYETVTPTHTVDSMAATYSGSLLKGAYILWKAEKIDENHTRLHYCFSLSFGKLLTLFIGDKTWRNVAEWRLREVVDNVVEYAETGSVKGTTPKIPVNE